MTTKIGVTRVAPDTGDDTEHMLNVFEGFLKRKSPGGSEAGPFLAALWLHTNHEPHPALPQYYHAYNDSYGEWAGDYLGTLTQMDVQIGRLRQLLKTYSVSENTLVWFTADNGPHEGVKDVRASTNGLRQCKASLFEGGIRVPGLVEWPAMITKHMETRMVAGVYDILPTVLDILKVPHEHPDWLKDGISLLPLITGATPISNPRPEDQPMCFRLGGQTTCIHTVQGQTWKIITGGVAGQCPWNDNGKPPPYYSKISLANSTALHYTNSDGNPWGKIDSTLNTGPFLFNLDTDPTETFPLNEKNATLFAALSIHMTHWSAGVSASQVNESTCMPQPGKPTPGPTPKPPGPPPSRGVFLTHAAVTATADANCLRATSLGGHEDLEFGACDGNSKWQGVPDKNMPSVSVLQNVGDVDLVVKTNAEAEGLPCKDGQEVFLGKDAKVSGGILNAFVFDQKNFTGTIPHAGCPGMCLSVETAGGIKLRKCETAGCQGWQRTASIKN
jgi:hypothetical protein